MQRSTRLDRLVRFTTLAASTAKDVADSTNIPFLKSTATLTAAIVECVQSVRSNKEQCILMVEQIHEILCAIVNLELTHRIDGVLPPAILYDIATFTETLQKVYSFVKSQQGLSKIKLLFKHFDHTSQLQECKNELQSALDKFRIQSSTETQARMVQMQKTVEEQHQQLLALIAAHPDLIDSDRASSATGTLSSMANSSGSISILPASPQIFHGRTSELSEVVELLKQESARIAILGTGGMGKTSLATAALHHGDIVDRFPNRVFVLCHSTLTCSDLVKSIASHIGVEQGPNLERRIVRSFSNGPPSILLLDNFETPWEPPTSRPAVENFLSLLADVGHLAIMITMRGAERPGKVKWSRPFLPPLAPLDSNAAFQTFVDVAGDDEDVETIQQLIELTGNLPLAVNLIANVAAYEGCDATVSRWRTESTRLLSDGYDKKSSLDISIMLSFSSSRMTGEAQDLLSVLSMLPDGFSDAEMIQSELPIPGILACKTTLLRTALAYNDNNHRVRVLVPIREHVRSTHAPSPALKFALRQYIHQVLALWKQFRGLPSQDIIRQLSANFGNFNSILEDGLDRDLPDIIQTLRSVLVFDAFVRMHSNAPSPIMQRLTLQIPLWKDHPVYGAYLQNRLFSSRTSPIPDPDTEIALGNQYFENADDLEKAQWNNALAAYYTIQGNQIEKALHCRQLALSLTNSTPNPSRPALQALTGIANITCSMGDYTTGQSYAQQAQQMAELLGDLLGQALAISMEARCCFSVGDFVCAAKLCRHGREVLQACGLQGTDTDLRLQSFEAEVHELKTEYLEARAIHVAVAASRSRGNMDNFSQLNIAVIDIAIGADSQRLYQTLQAARRQPMPPMAALFYEIAYADLLLRDENVAEAKHIFEKCFAKLRNRAEGAAFCLERLANPAWGMYDTQTTLGWAGVCLGWALKARNMPSVAKGLQCLASIFALTGDDDTALSLFQVALDGFTLMDVHRWRADCMVNIAGILEGRGDISKSLDLLEAARPLFERSSQAKDVARVKNQLEALRKKFTDRSTQLAALSPPVGELAGMSLDVSEGSGSSRTIGASSRMPA